MATYSIVIADDDRSVHKLYQRMFNQKTYEVRTASNGEEALKLIEAQTPDLLILDINMPVLDGFGVLEKLPKLSRRFPVVICTNQGDRVSRDRSAALGADGYIVKTEITMGALSRMIKLLLLHGTQD
jgi:DNA-binding response OmpR family regulator